MKKLKQEEIDAAIACSAEYGTLIKSLDEALYTSEKRIKITDFTSSWNKLRLS